MLKRLKFALKLSPAIWLGELIFPLGPFALVCYLTKMPFKGLILLGLFCYLFMLLFITVSPQYMTSGDEGDDGYSI